MLSHDFEVSVQTSEKIPFYQKQSKGLKMVFRVIDRPKCRKHQIVNYYEISNTLYLEKILTKSVLKTVLIMSKS